MKHVLLDTNFILSCVRKKIDFLDEIKFMGLKAAIPNEVVVELEKIKKTGGKKFQEESKIALKILEKNKFDKVDLNTKNVDNGIVLFAKKNPDYIIATLDRGIKSRIKNSKLTLRGNGKIEII